MEYDLDKLRKLDLPFNIDKVAPQCVKCVGEQFNKYNNYVDAAGNSFKDKFVVPCKGIPKDPVDPALKSAFTDEQWEELQAVKDITKWASKYLELSTGDPWIARWYQEEVLKCTSRRKVLRCSRRAGKTDLVCIEICYYLFNFKNIKIVVAGPQKNHTEEIINRVRAFIQSNPILQNSVVRDVSAPYYEIKLANGSRVRGFAAGAKGGTAGVGMRGQDADRIYLEEMDYIDENSITGAVLPILQTSPNTSLIGFSTPTGFKTTYRSFCEASPHYKEYHYNYKVLPHWREVEKDRGNFTLEKWTHEFLAEFGSDESGVYRPVDIEVASVDYTYDSCFRDSRWKYVIGADWNEKHGAEIVVLGFNPFAGKFKVVDAHVVEKAEFTQLASVSKFLEMYKKWRPDFAYVDAGNGSTNYELLMQASHKEKHAKGDRILARLGDILKKYDSGSSIITKDAVTQKDVRNPAKPFMVGASVRLFENHAIEISAHDHVLETQLSNYIIARVTPTKVPVYGLLDEKAGDHRLDALNLAIVAFHLEFSDLYIIEPSLDFGAVPDPRKGSDEIGASERLEDTDSKPSERRLEGDSFEEQLQTLVTGMGSVSGKINRQHKLPTNRPGWHEDMEESHRQEYLQRRGQHSKVVSNRPKRSTF